jgi:AraC-like DNA-binding protein
MVETATKSGFSDQAHMSREFKSVFGNSTTMVEEYLQQISHTELVER